MTTATRPARPVPRWYQDAAVDAFFEFVTTRPGDPLIVLPTGAGKSLTMALLIERARANHAPLRTAIIATQAELVQQNVKAAALLAARSDIGIYSAGLNQKDASRPITVANIQSLSRAAYQHEPFDLILIDEAHTMIGAVPSPSWLRSASARRRPWPSTGTNSNSSLPNPR